MKRINNKGFAITTIIYGLSIMGVLIITILMGIMATTRANSNKFARAVEQELIRFSKTDTSFSPNKDEKFPTAQEYVVPTGESGWYRIELWGAQGGASGGYGAYTSGVIKLEEGDTLYFYVGNSPTEAASGQSTDVRIIGGQYDNNDNASKKSYETRIMVAAGGGTGSSAHGGTLAGYTREMYGIGGKIQVKAATGQNADFNLVPTNKQSSGAKTNGTLIGLPENYKKSSLTMSSYTGTPKPHSAGSIGGDGYISSSSGNTGGISFISGYAGSRAYVKGKLTNDPKYVYHEYIYDDSGAGKYSTEGTEYYFYDGKMLAGVNAGDGRAKIERVVEETDLVKELPRKNLKLNSVKGVRDCLLTTNPGGPNHWTDIQVIEKGSNIASKATSRETTKSGGYRCKELTFSTTKDVDEIAVWHQDGIDYKNHTIEVTKDGYNWEYIKNISSKTQLSETETVNGIHISAYQPDYTKDLPDSGNYYIIPVISDNKALTSHESSDSDNDPLKISFLNGFKRQSWSIELINENLRRPEKGREYKIIELARFKSLSIYLDENKVGNQVRASSEFNTLSRNEVEIWKINPLGNGTYSIETIMPYFDSAKPSGNLIPQTNNDESDNYENVLIGPENPNTARFKFIAIDY